MTVPSEVLSGLELKIVYLHACSVDRPAVEWQSGLSEVVVDRSFAHSDTSEGHLIYLMTTTCDFKDEDDQVLVTIAATFGAGYAVAEGLALGEGDLEAYGHECVSFQLHPYFREFLASTVARMGLPPYVLPVLRLEVPEDPPANDSAVAAE